MTDIVCTHWKADVKHGRQGFADLSLPAVGITIRGIVLNASSSRRWISWPAVVTGRGYAPCFSFMATTEREVFQSSALAAIDQYVAGLDAGGHQLPTLL